MLALIYFFLFLEGNPFSYLTNTRGFRDERIKDTCLDQGNKGNKVNNWELRKLLNI